jgi:hypothetical protein
MTNILDAVVAILALDPGWKIWHKAKTMQISGKIK